MSPTPSTPPLAGRNTSNAQQDLPSRLEYLPTEITVAIMSTVHSPTDLHALIRASPILYTIFQSFKSPILLSLLTADLGPALRDAIALALLTPEKPESPEASSRALQQYATLLRGSIKAAARNLSPSAAVKLLRQNRSVQFFIDEYAFSRFPKMRDIHPEAAGPMTKSERQRLAQAILRNQVITRMQVPDGTGSQKCEALDQFVGMFSAWEMQQLVDVHAFMVDMHWYAFRVKKTPGHQAPLGPNPQRLMEQDILSRDICALRKKILADESREKDPGAVHRAVMNYRRARFTTQFEPLVMAHFQWLVQGPPSILLRDSFVMDPLHLRLVVYPHEDALPALEFTGDDDADAVTAPPFGWVDAHAGTDCQRWGHAVWRLVVPVGQRELSRRQQAWFAGKLDKWRWFGFVFWDRARVELLKTGLPVYGTGFLKAAPPSDSECDFQRWVPAGSRRRD